MEYLERVAEVTNEILAQAEIVEKCQDLRIGDLSESQAGFVKSIQHQFLEERRSLTQRQIDALVVILAWQKVDLQ